MKPLVCSLLSTFCFFLKYLCCLFQEISLSDATVSFFLLTVINSTYQPNDISSGTEEDVLYQSDASFSAKLDNSYTHNNLNNVNNNNNKKKSTNSIFNGNNGQPQSSSSVNKVINGSNKRSRYQTSSNSSGNNNNNSKITVKYKSKVEASNSATRTVSSTSISSQNTVHIDDKKTLDFYDKNIDATKNGDLYVDEQNVNDASETFGDDNGGGIGAINNGDTSDAADENEDDDEDDEDLDYNGNKSSASESIVIKIGSEDKGATGTIESNRTDSIFKMSPATILRTDTSTSGMGEKLPSLDDALNVDAARAKSRVGTTTAAEIINIAPASVTTPAPLVAFANDNYNNENYFSKDDMSVYDDVNNNRLNLRNSNARPNAYEERNFFVANNALTDMAANASDTAKSYIHIEVYKGNLDDLSTTKPKIVTAASKALNSADTKTTVRPMHANIKDEKTSSPSATIKQLSTTKP